MKLRTYLSLFRPLWTEFSTAAVRNNLLSDFVFRENRRRKGNNCTYGRK